MTTSATVLLSLALLCWVLLIAVLFTVVGEEAIGDRDIFLGLRWAIAVLLLSVSWLCLGSLLLMAGGQGLLRGLVNPVAWVLTIAAGAATFATLWLAAHTEMRWPLMSLAVPPLLAAYVLAIHRPSLQGAFASPGSHLAVWWAVAVLTIPAGAAFALAKSARMRAWEVQGQQYAAAEAQETQRKLAENRERLKSMSPDAHLTQWYPLLEPGSGVRGEAIEALKKVARRQADIEEGLANGIPRTMQLVPELDLSPTPELCSAGKAFLEIAARRLRVDPSDSGPYEEDATLVKSLTGVRWLQAHGCDCDEGVRALEEAARTHRDSRDRRDFLAELAAMRRAH
jgi:hypothetical protein